MEEMMNAMIVKAQEIFAQLLDVIVSVAQGMIDHVLGIPQSFIDSFGLILGYVMEFGPMIADYISSAMDEMVNILQTAVSFLIDIFSMPSDMIIGAISTITSEFSILFL